MTEDSDLNDTKSNWEEFANSMTQSIHRNTEIGDIYLRTNLFLDILATSETYIAQEIEIRRRQSEEADRTLKAFYEWWNGKVGGQDLQIPADVKAVLESASPSVEFDDGETMTDFAMVAALNLEAAERDFPNLIRRQVFVSAYQFFESYLFSICRAHRIANVELTISDIRGHNEIDRAYTYLTKVLRCQMPPDNNQLFALDKYRLLRNNLVHNNGQVEDQTPELRRWIESHTALDIIEEKRIFIGQYLVQQKVLLNRGFTEEVITTVRSFLVDVLNLNWNVLFPM